MCINSFQTFLVSALPSTVTRVERIIMSTEEKQQYLRTEIIDRGYDPDQFLQYFSQFGSNCMY